jgi:hypothetical protein
VLELSLLLAISIALNFASLIQAMVKIVVVAFIAPISSLLLFYAITLAKFICNFGSIGLTYEYLEAGLVKWVLFRSCSEGLAVFLLHNGIRRRALKHAIFGGISWRFFSGGLPLYFIFSLGYFL